MSSSSPISCNRQPFLSDQECDRGSVDIHQFDDFPFCESFSPTEAEIPPEIVDTPINLPIPPSCACINIDYALKFKYNQSRQFNASGAFSAKGDCCEGNYISNLNLEIPCPIIGSGTSKKIKMAIGYGKGKSSMSVSYLRADKDSCAIEAKNVDINLNIHCPVSNPQKRRIKIGISYGKDFNSVSASFIKANSDSCTIEALAPEFKLSIPCPIIRRDKSNPKIKAKIGWGSQAKSVSASYLRTDTEECTIEPYDVDLSLEIPCPIIGSGTSKKIKMAIGYGKGKSSMSVSYLRADKDSCAIEAKNVDINLNIHCPVSNPQKRRIKIGISYGKDFNSVSASFIKANSDSCTIEALSPELKLQIPCPVIRRSKNNPKITARVGWGQSTNSVSVSYLKTDTDDCTIEPYDVDLNLSIPCPVKKDQKKVKLGVKWGSKSYVSASLLKAASSSCVIEVNDATFNLEIPCPLKHTQWHIRHSDGWCLTKWRRRWVGTNNWVSYSTSFIKVNESSCKIEVGRFDLEIPCPLSKSSLIINTSASTTSGSVGDFSIKTDAYDSNNCTRSITFKAVFPTGGVDYSSGCSVIKEIRYYASKHALQIRTFNLKKKTTSAWKDVFTAVNHKSDHINCNDAD